MILLESIRIRNFRAISEVTFQPLQDGITGIIGQNGAGKSTLLYATVWALYGVRPPDTNVAALRREGSTGECSVSVVFRHLGQSVEVIRELRTSGKTNTTIVAIYVDGIPQTKAASVGAADAWILNRLGVDSNGFMTAFVVMQKELDELVKARPAERKAIIERLAGIDKINGALRLARDVENDGKRVLGNSSGSQEAVDDTENRMNVLADELEQRTVDRQALNDRLRKAEQQLRTIQSELRQIQQVQVTQAGASAALTGVQREVEQLDERIASLSYLQEMDAAGIGDLDALRAQHTELRTQLKDLQDRINKQKSQLNSNEYTAGEAQNRISEAESYVSRMSEKAADREAIEQENTQRRQAVDDGTSHRYLLLDRASSSEQAAEALARHAHAGDAAECPTCHTHLEDPSALIASLQKTAEDARAEITALDAEMSAHRIRLQELEQTLQELLRLDQQAEILKSSTETLKALEGEHELLQAAIATDEANAYALDQKLQEIAELGTKARSIANDRAALDEATRRRTEASERLTKITEQLTAAEEQLELANPQALMTQEGDLQQEVDRMHPKLDQLTQDRSNVERQLALTTQSYRQARDQWEKRKELLERQERLALASSTLEQFRSDTISSLAPEISDYATEMISEMTDGEFTEILLDDDFNASVVTREGVKRPVVLLSGGELSAVALALRIAIGYLITGGNPNLLWLDEALTAQDANRRSSVLGLLRNLSVKQIILINHTPEQADIVDKVVLLNKDPKQGSFIDAE